MNQWQVITVPCGHRGYIPHLKFYFPTLSLSLSLSLHIKQKPNNVYDNIRRRARTRSKKRAHTMSLSSIISCGGVGNKR